LNAFPIAELFSLEVEKRINYLKVILNPVMNLFFTGSLKICQNFFCFFSFSYVINHTLICMPPSCTGDFLTYLMHPFYFAIPADYPVFNFQNTIIGKSSEFSPVLTNNRQALGIDNIYPAKFGRRKFFFIITCNLFDSSVQESRDKIFICLENNSFKIFY